MAYTMLNFKTKKALKERVKERAEKGLEGLQVFQPGPFGPDVKDGPIALEGPHYPEPHRWYAQATIKDGRIVPGTVK